MIPGGCHILLQITIVYFSGVIITLQPFNYAGWLVGFALSVAMIGLFVLAVVLQILNGNSRKELDQTILEREARELDMLLSIKELQKDTAILVQLRNDVSQDAPRDDGARRVEWSSSNTATAGQNRDRGQPLTLKFLCCAKAAKADGFNQGSYPCFVVSHKDLCTFTRLPCHEDALAKGILDQLALGSRVPSPSHSYFVSQVMKRHAPLYEDTTIIHPFILYFQNWEGCKGSADTLVKMHPDNAVRCCARFVTTLIWLLINYDRCLSQMNSKLLWLQNLKQHLAVPPETELWIWWDGISLPQRDLGSQRRAVGSLCFYCQASRMACDFCFDKDRHRCCAWTS